MRRVMLLGAAMAFALVCVSGVALAASFQCSGAGDCFGTNNNDQIRERQGDRKQDDIHAKGGNDRVNAGRFDNDTDVVRGGSGNDLLITNDNDGRDVVICGSGNRDEARISDGDTVTDGCETITGGEPSDVVDADEAEALVAAL